MKKHDHAMLKRAIALVLSLALVFGSSSELFSGIATALAEERTPATPTDLMPRYDVVVEETEVSSETASVAAETPGEAPGSAAEPVEAAEQAAEASSVVEVAEPAAEAADSTDEPGTAETAVDASEETDAEEAAASAEPAAEETEVQETPDSEQAEVQEVPEPDQAEAAMETGMAASAAAVLKGDNSGEKVSALQQMIKKKLDGMTEKKGRVTITLSAETTYEGDVSIEKEDGQTYADDFGIDLMAEGAGDDGLQADGSSTIKGNLKIKGIAVRIVGVAVGGAISVEGAKAEIYGTKKDDTINVTAQSGAAVTVNAGAGNDKVTGLAKGGSTLTVNTGAGDDTVTADVLGSTLTVDGGEGSDTLNVNVYADSKATLNTGVGDDMVNLKDESAGAVQVDTGAGSDKVAINAGAGMGTVTVDTGDGDDAVSVANKGDAKVENPLGTVSVSLGAGNDETTLDMSLSEVVKQVSVAGGEGNDRMILTGALNNETKEDERITGKLENLQLAGSGHTLNVTSKEMEDYTDTLANKRTIRLNPGVGGTLNYVASAPFANYVLTAPSNKLSNIYMKAVDGSILALSSLVIESPSTAGTGKNLIISEGTTIEAHGLRLVLRGQSIEVNGTLKADQIELNAQDGTGMYTTSLTDLYNTMEAGAEPEQVGDSLADFALDLINVENKATIVIGEKAAVYSAGDVLMVAKVEQDGGVISFLPNVNLVNVKIARASIDIAGKVYAGYDFSKNETALSRGDVKAEASVNTVMGYDKEGKMLDGLPLAVNVADTEAEITVHKNATVEAAKNVTLSSNTTLKAAARADSGLSGDTAEFADKLGAGSLKGLPFSLALGVLVSNAHTTIYGKVNALGGSVKALANGRVEATTIAEKGSGQESISGGYLGVAVVLQDVKAKIGATGAVQAKKNVVVKSNATEKVINHATSGVAEKQDNAEGGDDKNEIADGVKWVVGKILDVIKEKITSPSAQEKLAQAMKKLTTSSKDVRLDEDAGKKGDVKLALDETKAGDQAVTGTITVIPWPGYKVKSITWRGYNPGDKTYTTGTVTDTGAFTLQAKTVVFFVEYEEDPNYNDSLDDTAADLFAEKKADEDVDLQQLLDDTTNSINDDSSELDKALKELDEHSMPLKLEGAGGAVLTYEVNPENPTESQKTVIHGEKLRLVPNPENGKALKQGGLKVTYFVKENDKLVEKTGIVNPDGQNRYYFTVPDDADVEKGLSVKGEFVDSSDRDAQADETQTQVTGTIAVTVAKNDNLARVEIGAKVTSGGKTEIIADANTDIAGTGDGSAVSKEAAEAAKKKDGDAIQRPDAKAYAGFDASGREYALVLDATENGLVSYEKGKGDYAYTFEANAVGRHELVSAVVVYYEGGERKTKELTATDDGKYELDLNSLKIDKGTTAHVSFAFGSEDGKYWYTGVRQAEKTLLPNAIKIAYNAMKDEDNLSGYKYAGKVYYKEAKTDDSGKITGYVFEASPDEKKGYQLDGALKATWTDEMGQKKEAALTQNDKGQWVLDPKGIPAGALITVTGAFKGDFHAFKTGDSANGTVTLHDSKVKQADAPKITVTPNAGYSTDDIVVTWTEGGRQKTMRLSEKDSKITKAKDKDGKEIENVYTFEVPGMSANTDISVKAFFSLKSIGVYAGNGDTAKDYVLSEKNVAPGDKVTVTPNAEKVKAGYKIGSLTVKDAAGKTIYQGNGDSFTVPKDTAKDAKLTVTATLKEKDIAVEKTKLENGSVAPALPRADRGEKVSVTVTPDSNFKVKSGTLKAVLTATDGSYTEEVYMTRDSDTAYHFTMPAGIEDPSKVKVAFTGEFEPGQSNSSEVQTSVGAGVAVTVALSENRADVWGEVTSAGDVSVKATQTGGAKTETKAGYSKGNIGVGGAVSVQVASMSSKALIYKSAQIALDGALALTSEAAVNYEVTADASGNKTAGKAGVGAGVAVAVNGTDAFAAMNDGAKLAAKTAGGKMQSLSVLATQKGKDTVSAKAGAAGGTAVVPVAAVNVIGTSAEAYLGRVSGNALPVSGNVALSATNGMTHQITADAAATGKGAGIGAAIAVSVASDTAVSRLNQSVNSAQATVASETVSDLTETATASASGGKSGGKSPDQQADGLLGGAAKAAGKNGSKNVSSKKIDNAVKNRQKGETSEGTVGVAGAVVVNVQEGSNRSEIVNGVDVTATGLVGVTAANRTEAKIRANASTTNSDVGVGVGVAVNVVTLNNLATIGDGEIRAAMLRVTAKTKEKEPDRTKTVKAESVDTTDQLAKQLGAVVAEYMNDLAKDLGLTEYVPETLLGELLGPAVTNATNELIKATGLSEALGSGDLNAKMDQAKGLLSNAKDGLLSLPEKLAEPFVSALKDAMELKEDVGSMDWDAIKKTAKEIFTTQLTGKLESAGKSVLNGVKDGMIEYIKENVSDLFCSAKEEKGSVSGAVGTVLKALIKQAGKEILKATKKNLKALVVDVWKETVTKLTAAVPGFSQQNIDAAVSAFSDLKDAYQERSVSGYLEDAADFVMGTFKENVFDYEKMLVKISGTDFGTEIANALRSAAKKAAVTLTNTAISKLTSHFDLTLEAEEEKATGHVFTTEAIAGAGARDVGVAGSAAITVLNAATKATLSDSGKAVTVTGNTEIDASELRSVRNVASAALDAKGKADANKSAEKDANKDVGGGSDAESVASGMHAKLTVGPGGTAEVLQGDKTDDKPRMYISLKEGYAIPKDGKADYTYTLNDGTEVIGKVAIQKDDQGRYYVDPKSGELAKAGDKTDVAIEVKPVEVLNTIAKPDTLTDGTVKLEEGAVTVGVEGREKENDTLSARAGETVQIRIAKGAGRKVSQVGYSWKDASGKNHDVELNTGKDAKRTKEWTLVSSNEKEYIYSFNMPEGAVTGVVVAFEAGEAEDAEDAKTAAKDDAGKRVGVGAAFSMIYGDAAVDATVGGRSVTAGELSVTAKSDHHENVAGSAGTDPLTGALDTNQTKKFSLDASVALNILDNTVRAGTKNAVKTTGYTDGGAAKAGDLTVTATENSVTETASSAYAVGGKTAIGATAAVNIASTGVAANLPDATAAGSVTVGANSHSEDKTTALATAMGADIARNLAKIGEKAENLATKANGLMDGSYIDKIGKKDDNKTANKINSRLDQKKGTKGQETNGNASTSTNALRSLGVEVPGEDAGNEGAEEAEKLIKEKTDKDVNLKREKKESKWQVAAAVGVTVADHTATTTVGTIVAGGKIAATAENTGNFNTQGTGASMSLAEHANSIAAGVAVSVNDNRAKVTASGDLISNNKEDIAVTSKLTQNLDGDFAGKLAAQALSGSVAGKDSAVSIGGAVSVVVSGAESTVDIAGGTAEAARRVSGGTVTVEATDKSKLAARAGGLSLSKGSNVGMGIASTNIISGNTVSARVGDYANITAGSLKLNAEKLAVTDDDYKSLIDRKYVITDSSALTEEQWKTADTGLIDLHKDGDSYKVDVHLSSEKLLEAVDGLNFLSAQNTYLEAIAGSIMTGTAGDQGTNKSYLSLGGSVAVAVTNNTITSKLGGHSTVTLTGDGTRDGGMTLNAGNGNNARIIAGALSASPAKANVGVTIAVLIGQDTTRAETGAETTVTADGNVSQRAETTGEIQAFTAAMSVSAGVQTKAAVGGAVNVIVTRNRSESVLGNNVHITSNKDSVNVGSRTAMDLMTISGSASVAAGSGVAAGGTVNVIYDLAKAATTLGDQVGLTAAKDLSVASAVKDRTLSGTASLSAAISLSGKAGAGVANVIIGRSAANTDIGAGAALTATGDLKTTADNDAWLLNASLAASGGTKTAVGLAFNVNVIDRTAKVALKDGALKAGGNLYARAGGVDTDILAGLTVAGAVAGSAGSGNFVVLVESNQIGTEMAGGVTAEAGGSADLESYYQDRVVDIGGSIAASLSSMGIGGTVTTVVRSNVIKTSLASSTVTAHNTQGTAAQNLAGKAFNGIYVGASAVETQGVGAAGVAAAGGTALNGVVTVLVNNNAVKADASQATLNAGGEVKTTRKVPEDMLLIIKDSSGKEYDCTIDGYPFVKDARGYRVNVEAIMTYDNVSVFRKLPDGGRVKINNKEEFYQDFTEIIGGGDVTVTAREETTQLLLAGGLSASLGAGVGAAVVTVVNNKEVEAKANRIDAAKNASILADNNDSITQLAISAGISGGTAVQIGAAVQVLNNTVNAGTTGIGSAVKTQDGDFNLEAHNDTTLYNIGAAVAAGGGAAVAPVGVVTWFSGKSDARLGGGSEVSVGSEKIIHIEATSKKDINLYSVGATAGSAGISGAVNVLVSRDTAHAGSDSGTTLQTAGDVNLNATGDYRLRAASAAIAAGSVGVGVNAIVSVMKSNTTAELSGETKSETGAAKNVNVNANTKRDVIGAVASLGAGSVGAGVSALVLVAGTKMSQDAADMIAYGNGSSKEKKTGFDAKAFLDLMEANGVASQYYRNDPASRQSGNTLSGDSLAEELAGNGRYESQQAVGTSSGEGKDRKSTFDAASTYRSADFDNKSFNDQGDKMRGEEPNGQDTEDIKRAKALNTYTYESRKEDEVVARINEDAVVKATSVSVKASQPVAADLIGATIGAGATGVGVSAAVAILHSNVIASSMGTITGADAGVTVQAQSYEGNLKDDTTAGNRDNTILDLLSNNGSEKQTPEEKQGLINRLKTELNPANRAIRTFALAGGAGAVGVAVSASVVLTDNITEAVLGGAVKSDGIVRVQAMHDYGAVLAATGSLAAGAVAANASVSVAQATGTVKAKVVDRNNVPAEGKSKKTIQAKNLLVYTDSNVTVDAVAVSAGVGGVAVNAGLALAINRLKQDTGIGAGTVVDVKENVSVTGESKTMANSYLLGVAIGAVGVSVNAAVSNVEATLNTYIGEKDGQMADVKADGQISVLNDVKSDATPVALTAALGGVAVGGNVLLAFNTSKVEAAARNANLNGMSLKVVSNLAGTAESSLAALQVGLIAVGLSVNYADIQAENRATVEKSTLNMTRDVKVLTGSGDDNYDTFARADTISANAGVISAGMNAAIARNRTKNYAILSNDGMEGDSHMIIGGALTVHAAGQAMAKAKLTGLQIGALRTATTAVVALNDADTRTKVRAKDLVVTGKTTFNVTQNAETTADIEAGGGSLFGALINVAAAYGKTTSLIDATLSGKYTSMAGGLEAKNEAADKTVSTITNQSFDIIAASAMVGAAYSQDVVDTKVRLTAVESDVHGDATVTTNYDMTNTADVTPSAGGLSASLAELALNLALAKNTVYAGAELEAGGEAKITGALTVQTISGTATYTTSTTEAKITPAKITATVASMGANMAYADLSATEGATLRLSGTALTVGGAALIQAQHRSVKATATLGTSGKPKGSSYNVSLINTKTNLASARQNLGSTAAILGETAEGATALPTLTADSLKLEANASAAVYGTTAEARTDGAKNISIATAGNLSARSVNTESENVVARKAVLTITNNVDFNAITNGVANAIGYAPGDYAVINGGASDVYAGIGTEQKKQSARMVLGDGVKISSKKHVNLTSENRGSATAKMEKKGSGSLGSLQHSTQPTESWYDTSMILGKNVDLKAADPEIDGGDTYGFLNVITRTIAGANSHMNADSMGILLNADTMKGENKVNEENTLIIGDGSKLRSGNTLNVNTRSDVNAQAYTEFEGKIGVWGGSKVNAKNTITRNVTLQVGDNVTIASGSRSVFVESFVGERDNIETHAKQNVNGIMEFAKAEGRVDTTVNNRLLVGAGTQITAGRNVEVVAKNTGRKSNSAHAYGTRGDVDATGLKFDAAPDGYAILNMNYTTQTIINPTQGETVKLTAKRGHVYVRATNEKLYTETQSEVTGDGGVGGIDAYALTTANLKNEIWVDKVDFSSTAGTGLYASCGELEGGTAQLNSGSTVKLRAALGYESPTSRMEGGLDNVIRTHDRAKVVAVQGAFEHRSGNQLGYILGVNCEGWANIIPRRHAEDKYSKNLWCDLCYNRDSTGGQAKKDAAAELEAALKKALSPLEDITRMVKARDEITRAPAPKMDREATEKLYVLDVEAPLAKDVRLTEEERDHCWLWINSETHQEVYLLPNATRLCAGAGLKLQYVAEVLRGDVLGDGVSRDVDVFSALTPYAVSNPVIPIGSTGSLDFASGVLSIPDQAVCELYLHEVSGQWLIERMKDGFFQALIAPQEVMNDFVLGSTDLPEGYIVSGITEEYVPDADGADDTLFWLGETPDTAADPDRTLIYLHLEPETDEIDAFRTTANMYRKGEKPVDVSLFLYRDSKSDRMGVEKYNVIFYDTPEGEENTVWIVSSVLMDRTLEMPKTARFTLRKQKLETVEFPAYMADGHVYVLGDATDGEVSLLNNVYKATFDGDTFASDYVRIEGIREGNVQVTLKGGQTIWPKWIDENTARDLEGRTYLRVGDTWTEAASQSKR